jgi:protein-S-isoprenylcysteine O-methyltransferase Ste14
MMIVQTSADRRIIASYLAKTLVSALISLGILLFAAGRINWWPAWIFSGIVMVVSVASAFIADPALLAERTKVPSGAKVWDYAVAGLAATVLPLLGAILAGLDERFGWQPEVPPTMQVIAGIVCMLGYAILVWSMWANRYFSAIVRIQTDRGHQVATSGPYRIVRHPGYVGAILYTLAMPALLGSVWALIPAVLAATLFVVRTYLEDRTLHAELPGYPEFAQQTRYRLLPGVW